MAIVLIVDHALLMRAWLAVTLVAAALAVTIALSIQLRRSPARLFEAPAVVTEGVVAIAVFILGGWAFQPGGGFATAESLGAAWPVAAVLSAAAAWGTLPGMLAGVVMGVARIGGALLNGASGASSFDGRGAIGLLTPLVIFAIAGATVGYLVSLLRAATATVATARAREEVARILHDGVLQTLALVERRTDDPDLSRLAREQEQGLRAFLATSFNGSSRQAPTAKADLEARLREAAGRFERTYGGRVDVIVAEDLPDLVAEVTDAITGAVGEALTNAGKHGGAGHVTVYVEPDDDRAGRRDAAHVFCSVKDDGSGFDAGEVSEGIGLARSIRGRIEDVGGRVELGVNTGTGAEVRLWV